MNPPDLTGGCLCGAVRYRIAGSPEFVGQCFCRDCQKATGTGHTTVVGVLEPNLSVVGARGLYQPGESGPGAPALLPRVRRPPLHLRRFRGPRTDGPGRLPR